MSENGAQLLASIKGMRNFFSDVSLMLQTCDALMKDSGWPTSEGNECLTELSYSVAMGSKWMPKFAYRFYENPKYPLKTAIISILLDDSDLDFTLIEPIISATVFTMLAKDTEIELWQVRWYAWSEIAANGTTRHYSQDDRDLEWQRKWGWSKMSVFGRPLVSITDEQKIKELIVEPLLTLLAQGQSSIAGQK